MSFPLTSKLPPNCGEVSSTTSAMPPIFIDSIFGFVPSSAFAYAILSPLSVAEKVNVDLLNQLHI